MKYNKKINIVGLFCPDPIILIRHTLRKMNKNNILLIIADDPTTKREIPIFCHFIGHQLLKKNIKNIPYQYFIQKR
ncbi:sulfurtransferase TusA [Buchnera aphidicola]